MYKHYIAVPKQNVVFFIYSLLVQIMYITVNKATFIVNENIKLYIKNSLKYHLYHLKEINDIIHLSFLFFCKKM